MGWFVGEEGFRVDVRVCCFCRLLFKKRRLESEHLEEDVRWDGGLILVG